ncbi:Wzz/FepE/Etk N-terminal domain-containing protein [Ulvibacter litoralis]|uniref:Chain length determinant protein n=1 Tax=Ulvibacter litoralis TaxID=227084 RepID=A0A1G7HM36_9FLAO|nr:Wzz/FepE/Etk N-terminal domain-containing protein [Ulvibacter litoralis]GHC58353.1 hypothetical protein GCM10008083_23870 [Ulvibacter litoralis]SDF01540.1 Chain length determinant protein [Ulvibacter litoralis]
MEEEFTPVEKVKINIFSEDILLHIIKRRRFVIIFGICFFVLGLALAILSTKKYTSKAVIVPQMNSSQGVSKKYAKIASLAGINLNSGESSNILPTIYPLILSSAPFQKELLKTPLTIKGQDSTVSLTNYLSNIRKPSFLDKVKKYTIGLPGLLINSLKSKPKATASAGFRKDTTLFEFTPVEKGQIGFLDGAVEVKYNDLDGYIEIIGTLEEPLASAELAQRAYKLLEQYVIEYNIQKSKDELTYIQERFVEAEENFFEKRAKLGNYRERNQNLITTSAINRGEQYKIEYDLAYSIYSEISSEFESAKLQVKRDTPIFTVIKPVTVPTEPSYPNKLMIIIKTFFFGIAISIFILLYKYFKPYIKDYINY